MRYLLILATVAVLACGGASLTDAEKAWCPDHAIEVAHAAVTLGLPQPATDETWGQWALYVTSGVIKGNLYDSLTFSPESMRPNRDRACQAAFAGR